MAVYGMDIQICQRQHCKYFMVCKTKQNGGLIK